MKRLNKKDNLLEYKPERNPDIVWRKLENGHIELELVNKGFFHFLAQKLLKKPRISRIEMEEIGSFIWESMDGQKTVQDLSEELEEKFKEKARPTLGRLVSYLKVLYSNALIRYHK